MTTGSSNSNGNSTKRKGWPRGRKRRLMPKDVNAPKEPLSGYMLFMNEQREAMKQAEGKLPGFTELNKAVSQKWGQMDISEKQKYLDMAAVEKSRYQEDLEKYKQTDSHKKFIAEHESKTEIETKKVCKEIVKIPPKIETNETSVPVPTNGLSNPSEIPIFTEAFLNHNKIREGELRQLRKSTTEYEEQNIILQKYIENMKSALTKLESETAERRTKAVTLRLHLTSLKASLAQAFDHIAVPGTGERVTEETAASYLRALSESLSPAAAQQSPIHQKTATVAAAAAQDVATSMQTN